MALPGPGSVSASWCQPLNITAPVQQSSTVSCISNSVEGAADWTLLSNTNLIHFHCSKSINGFLYVRSMITVFPVYKCHCFCSLKKNQQLRKMEESAKSNQQKNMTAPHLLWPCLAAPSCCSCPWTDSPVPAAHLGACRLGVGCQLEH